MEASELQNAGRGAGADFSQRVQELIVERERPGVVMAKPLTLQMPARDAHAELLEKLQNAPVTHAAAILDWYELLQQLHDSGVMSALRGAAGEGGQIVK